MGHYCRMICYAIWHFFINFVVEFVVILYRYYSSLKKPHSQIASPRLQSLFSRPQAEAWGSNTITALRAELDN